MNAIQQKTIKVGFLVLIFSIFGKVFSFVREVCFSSIFGTTNITDAYFSANIIPNILNIPITISPLIFFIPLYNERKIQEGPEAANQFSSNVLTTYTIITTILTLFVLIFASSLTKIISPGFDEETFNYSVDILRLLSLTFPITLIASVFINISNANQRHFSPQLLVVINSSIAIATIVFLAPKYGIFVVPVAGIVAWIFQMFFQRFFIKDIFKYNFVIDFKNPFLKKIIILAIPVIIASFAEQINLMVCNILCSKLGEGSISSINYALRILNLVNGTITIAIITVMYPIFSLLVAQKDYLKFSQSLNSSIKVCLLIIVPISILCMVGGYEIIELIYFRGKMTLDSIFDISHIFTFYSIGIIFIALREIYVRIFYTLNNSIIPMFISLACSLLNIILNILLIGEMGVGGIALATSIANILYFILIRILLTRKFSFVSSSIENKFYLQLGLAAITTVSMWYILRYFFYKDNLIYFICAVFLCLGAYMLALYLSKNRELSLLLSEAKENINNFKNSRIK